MLSELESANGLNPISETFIALIHRVPNSEEEAEWIISTVEKMISDHPSFTRYLELAS